MMLMETNPCRLEEHYASYQDYLIQEEKSEHTIQKYMADVKRFFRYLDGREVTKKNVLLYKAYLNENYQISSVNSILASLNHFFHFSNCPECGAKTIRTQKKLFCPEETMLHQREYERLLRQAQQEGRERLAMIMRTLGYLL